LAIAWWKSILLPMSFSSAGYDGAPMAEQMWDDYLSVSGWSNLTPKCSARPAS
jgi:hypothetical protein